MKRKVCSGFLAAVLTVSFTLVASAADVKTNVQLNSDEVVQWTCVHAPAVTGGIAVMENLRAGDEFEILHDMGLKASGNVAKVYVASEDPNAENAIIEIGYRDGSSFKKLTEVKAKKTNSWTYPDPVQVTFNSSVKGNKKMVLKVVMPKGAGSFNIGAFELNGTKYNIRSGSLNKDFKVICPHIYGTAPAGIDGGCSEGGCLGNIRPGDTFTLQNKVDFSQGLKEMLIGYGTDPNWPEETWSTNYGYKINFYVLDGSKKTLFATLNKLEQAGGWHEHMDEKAFKITLTSDASSIKGLQTVYAEVDGDKQSANSNALNIGRLIFVADNTPAGGTTAPATDSSETPVAGDTPSTADTETEEGSNSAVPSPDTDDNGISLALIGLAVVSASLLVVKKKKQCS